MDYLKYLESVRLSELEGVLVEIRSEKPSGSRVLEIGSGTGFQARKLQEGGYDVTGIDIEKDIGYSAHRVWPVMIYDGKHIPFPDASFDIVFSSNVLEHVPHLRELQKEIGRVLRPDGLAIHLLPTSCWRFWTNLTYYPFVLRRIASALIVAASSNTPDEVRKSLVGNIRRKAKLELIKEILIPGRHGETGNAFSELYYFSRHRWYKEFESCGWKVLRYSSNRLFYTGYMIMASRLSISSRRYLSRFLGSSCHVFTLTRTS